MERRRKKNELRDRMIDMKYAMEYITSKQKLYKKE